MHSPLSGIESPRFGMGGEKKQSTVEVRPCEELFKALVLSVIPRLLKIGLMGCRGAAESPFLGAITARQDLVDAVGA